MDSGGDHFGVEHGPHQWHGGQRRAVGAAKKLNATVLVLVIALLRMPESRDDDAATTLDWPGAALATQGLGTLVNGLIESSSLGFSHRLVLATLTSAVVAFMVIEKR
ncbi:MAG: hypothetical protein ACXWYD_01300 [Candidatus Binatia bacterium]